MHRLMHRRGWVPALCCSGLLGCPFLCVSVLSCVVSWVSALCITFVVDGIINLMSGISVGMLSRKRGWVPLFGEKTVSRICSLL